MRSVEALTRLSPHSTLQKGGEGDPEPIPNAASIGRYEVRVPIRP